MDSLPITSVFNDGYIEEMYESYRRDPASVDESWRQFFRIAERLTGAARGGGATASAELLRDVAEAAALVQAIRNYGHLAVQIDPLGSPPPGAVELSPEFHGLTQADLERIPGSALGFDERFRTAADVVARLRSVYCRHIGYEVWHLQADEEREWFRQQFRDEELTRPLTPDEKKRMLERLSEVDGLERFLGRAYAGYKRFSVEGTDALVSLLDAVIDESAAHGAREVVIGMAHRGRINVLAHILGKPYATIFEEFEGKHPATNAESETGDVKYHLGYKGERTTPSGQRISVILSPNPSHLEVVNPVVEGMARAHQRVAGAAPGTRDESIVVPVLVHGDAAFPGEGVVPETINLSRLVGFRTGGTIHVIANNQVGFTTDPIDGRSTHYASDLAKGFDVPILHVNADDAEAVVTAVRIGAAYRARFAKDFLIDLVGYRRHGHNEGDEPTYTQPKLYASIKAHPTPREVWGKRLVDEGVATPEFVTSAERAVADRLAGIHAAMKSGELHPPEHRSEMPEEAPIPGPIATAVDADRLRALNERLLLWPGDFHPHPRLAKQLERRRDALGESEGREAGGIDWGHAEALAFASILVEGTSVRFSGQDVERGTFSHRHAVLHDVETGSTYTPLQHVGSANASFEIYNSPLSETAVLGFEYGFSVASPETLTLWEAQFGDFVNVAQPIIDQFLVADRAKWGQDSGVVLLLPHGYEGQGPEHSSARLERFLQSAAEGNMTVAYPSTPAQYFHILRRQAKRDPRRPLVLMQPKSLLRLPAAASRLSELSQGSGFQPVIDDPIASQHRDDVRRVVFCTGKIYYDLSLAPHGSHVALVRVEELYPWPHAEITRVIDLYPAVEEVVWAQEEPKNMGAWSYVYPLLRASAGAGLGVKYIGRPERASPAEGYLGSHVEVQSRIVATVLEQPEGAEMEQEHAEGTETHA